MNAQFWVLSVTLTTICISPSSFALHSFTIQAIKGVVFAYAPVGSVID